MNKKNRKHNNQPEQEQQPSSFSREEASREELSFKVTEKPVMGETVVLTLPRHLVQYLISEIERYGRAILWDLGILKKAAGDAGTKFILEPFLKADTWRPRLLFGRQELVGKVARVLYLQKEGPLYYPVLYFPVHTILERMASHQNISSRRLQRKFQQQMGEAFFEMIKSGEGRLPGFGALRCDELKLPWFLFDPDENMAPFIEEADHGLIHVLRPWHGAMPLRDKEGYRTPL